MAAEDEGVRSGTLEKQHLLVDARSDEDKGEAEELRLNLKLRAKAEGGVHM